MPRTNVAVAALVICFAAPSSAAGGDTAPQEARSLDPTAEVRHEGRWVEVAQVPPPTSLPLAGPPGKDPDGYPRRYVDRPALRSLLVNRRFAALTAAFEKFQAAFEADPRCELWIADATESVGMPHPRERALLDDWVRATPRSFAPYLARAQYWVQSGFLYRGSQFARDTSDLEFSSMAEAFERAGRDAARALALRPRLVAARGLLIQTEIAGGSRRRAERVLEDALRICPTCYEIRAHWVGWALRPRWGGSLEEMEAFARTRADPRNPRHRLLRGFVDFELALEAMDDDRREEALAAIDRACALGDDWRFFRERAAQRRQSGDHQGRLADLERADAIRPGQPWVAFGLAWAHADAQRWEEAARDLLYVLRSDPTSTKGIWLQPRVVRALDVMGWRAYRDGRPSDARRLYDLACALAPADAGIAQRSAAASRAAPPPAGGAPAAGPLAGDDRPELTVSVVDADGRPVEGAPVVLAPGGANWEALARMAERPEGAPRTDGSGRLRAPAPMGLATIAVFAPGEQARAAAATVAVPTTGAEVRIALGAGEGIDGRVVDRSSRPVPGVEVRAIPDVDRLGTDPRTLGSATSGSDGAFAIRGLDTGRYRLLARGNGYVGGLQVEGGRRRLEIQVSRERTLRVRVLLGDPGRTPRPAERFEVQGAPFGTRTSSSPDGRLSVGFAMGRVQVPITFSVEGRPPLVRTLDLDREDTDAGDVVIGPGRKVRGIVVDPRGAPVAAADVLLKTGVRVARTAQTGRFEVLVQDGPVDLVFAHPRWLRSTRTLGENEEAMEVRLSEGAKLKLLAIDVRGEPVSGAMVTALLQGRPRSCSTDTTGRCEIGGLEEGTYWIVPRSSGPDVLAPAPLFVRVAAGERGLRIRWPRERTRLSVHVLDQNGNEIAAPAFAFPGAPGFAEAMDEKREPKVPYHLVRARTALENLAPDLYTVVAIDPWRVGCALGTVELRGGDEKDVKLSMGDGSCR